MIDLLYNHSKDVYSENGEDGINQAIFDHLEITCLLYTSDAADDW